MRAPIRPLPVASRQLALRLFGAAHFDHARDFRCQRRCALGAAVHRTHIMLIVEMAIDRKVTPFIKKNSTATIGSQGLMGAKLIVLLPGTDDESIVQGDVPRSVAPIEADDILREIKVSSERISVVSGNLIDITTKMSQGEGVFGKIFRYFGFFCSFTTFISLYQFKISEV